MGTTMVAIAFVVALAAGCTALRERIKLGWWLSMASSGATWLALVVLALALLREDTALAYVVDQTRPNTSWVRRLTGLWSGAAGSLLTFTAAINTALLAGQHRRARRWQRVGTAVVSAGLLAAVGRAASPFTTVALAPAGGSGMAPILEHGAMAIHPPMLYVGMALALTPGLVADRRWAQRLSALAAATLSAALTIGASWAYVELGWGGWWAWDPIENVGLVVWLVLAAALHANLTESRTGTGMLSAPVLWAACWPLVLAGTALTRTSLRTSVHAFADAEGLGRWLWPLAAIAAVGAALRVRAERPTISRPGQWPRRLPAQILVLAAAVIAVGTYRPFVPGDLTDGWFYTRSLFPVAVVGAVACGVLTTMRAPTPDLIPGPLPERVDGTAQRRRRVPTVGIADTFFDPGRWRACTLGAGLGGLATITANWTEPAQLVLAGALGAGLAGSIWADRGRAARLLSHTGVLLVLVAALGGTAGSDAVVRIQEGETVTVEGQTLRLERLELTDGRRPQVAAIVAFGPNGDNPALLTPSVTFYPDRNLRLPEIAVHSRPWLDVLLILRDVDPDEGALLTVRLRPLTQLVWWGVGLTTIGLLLLINSRSQRGQPSWATTEEGRLRHQVR